MHAWRCEAAARIELSRKDVGEDGEQKYSVKSSLCIFVEHGVGFENSTLFQSTGVIFPRNSPALSCSILCFHQASQNLNRTLKKALERPLHHLHNPLTKKGASDVWPLKPPFPPLWQLAARDPNINCRKFRGATNTGFFRSRA
jgi:hypothetical protein